MKQICSDLKAEHDALEAILVDLDEEKWMTMTPSPGWTIKDQISHLAYFDGRVALSVIDPDAFKKHLEEVMTDMNGFMETLNNLGKDMSISQLMDWWRDERKKNARSLCRHRPQRPAQLVWPPYECLIQCHGKD